MLWPFFASASGLYRHNMELLSVVLFANTSTHTTSNFYQSFFVSASGVYTHNMELPDKQLTGNDSEGINNLPAVVQRG